MSKGDPECLECNEELEYLYGKGEFQCYNSSCSKYKIRAEIET